jgi:hypothetical protein
LSLACVLPRRFTPAQLLKSGEDFTGDANYESTYCAICDEKLGERDERQPWGISIAQFGDMGGEDAFVDAGVWSK